MAEVGKVAVPAPGSLNDLIRKAMRRALLIAELDGVGFPNAAEAVKKADWAGILQWVTDNLPAILGLITALIGLIG